MTGRPRTATALAATWTVLLVGLAALWVRSPFLGTGPAFLAWSGPAAVVATISWRWLRGQAIEQIPLSGGLLAAVILAWAGALWLSTTAVGARLALDGLIMRREELRVLGRALVWLPLLFGLGLSVVGLAASLEARYRLLHAPRDR